MTLAQTLYLKSLTSLLPDRMKRYLCNLVFDIACEVCHTIKSCGVLKTRHDDRNPTSNQFENMEHGRKAARANSRQGDVGHHLKFACIT